MPSCLYCVGDFDKIIKSRDDLFFTWDNFSGGGERVDGDIVFYIHGDTIEYGGELFSAGELTADILNLSLKDYQGIQKNVQRMKDLKEQYERTQDREFWRKLNYQFMALRKRMMEFRVFQILLRDDSKFFNEARRYFSSTF